MSPIDVVIVKRKPSKPALLGRFLGAFVLGALVGGWLLMLLVPLAAETVGTPAARPSYWQSVAVFFLLRHTVYGLRSYEYPEYAKAPR